MIHAPSTPTPRPSKRPGRAKALTCLLALAMLLGGSSCKSGEQWTFSVTREFYSGDPPDVDLSGYNCNPSGNDWAALGVVAILLLPVAIDLVILPITLTHDLCDLD